MISLANFAPVKLLVTRESEDTAGHTCAGTGKFLWELFTALADATLNSPTRKE